MDWLQMELIRWLSSVGELSQKKDADSKYVITQWWIKSSQTLPKGQNGPNCPYSFVSGMVNNLIFGTQHDLTEKQMDALQNISMFTGSAFEACSKIQFRMELFDHGR